MVNKTLIKYKIIIKELGYTGVQMAKLIDINYASYRSATRKNGRVLPKWVRVIVVMHEILNRKYRRKIEELETKLSYYESKN